MIEITKAQADELIKKHWSDPRQKLVICAFGKWYDIRGMTNDQIKQMSHDLITARFGVAPKVIKEMNIEVKL
jgi:hypothetical protein